jgi:DNA-binding NarL/FixJ family response regulator
MHESEQRTNRFDLTASHFRERTAVTDEIFRQFNVVGATGSVVEAHLMGRLGLSGGIPNLVGCGMNETEIIQLCDSVENVLLVMTESIADDFGLSLIETIRRNTSGSTRIFYVLQDLSLVNAVSSLDVDSLVLAESFGTGIIALALKAILAGRRYLDPGIDRVGLERSVRLTKREQQVLLLLQNGLTNKEIASALAISPVTIRDYVQSLMTKLDANNRTMVVVNAAKHGLL